MKKLLALMFVASLLTLLACNQSGEGKNEKAKQDAVRKSDSLTILLLKEKIKNDSIIILNQKDSLAQNRKQQQKKKVAWNDCGD